MFCFLEHSTPCGRNQKHSWSEGIWAPFINHQQFLFHSTSTKSNFFDLCCLVDGRNAELIEQAAPGRQRPFALHFVNKLPPFNRSIYFYNKFDSIKLKFIYSSLSFSSAAPLAFFLSFKRNQAPACGSYPFGWRRERKREWVNWFIKERKTWRGMKGAVDERHWPNNP